MTVIDVTPLFEARRRHREPAVRTYRTILIENLSPGELAHRLRGTGLALSNRHGTIVLHESTEPPSAA